MTPEVNDEATLSGGDESLPIRTTDPLLERFPVGAAPGGERAWPGRLVAGRYRLAALLGAGAFGEVWAADDLVLGEPVALKWMLRAGGPLLARIRQEITMLRMLCVPGVVRLLDDGVEGGQPFLVMERVDGAPFPGSAPPQPGSPLRWRWSDLADTTRALLEVLARVHAAGVVHRDLKPDNLLVSSEGRPTLLDFGISRWSEPCDRLTEAGKILGTPLYLAPEQILDGPVDNRTDLYAVGVMLYAALTGQVPHEAHSVQALLRARLMERPPPLHELAPDVPAAVAGTIDRLLATRREDRPRSAAEVLAALRGQASATCAALEGEQIALADDAERLDRGSGGRRRSELAEGSPREHWSRRIDVLSVEEALEGAQGEAMARADASAPPLRPDATAPRPLTRQRPGR